MSETVGIAMEGILVKDVYKGIRAYVGQLMGGLVIAVSNVILTFVKDALI